MDWSTVGNFVAKSAPLLGSLFGPAGTAGGAGVSLLLNAFGLAGDTTPEDALKAIQMDPEHLIKLKEIEATHEVELKKLLFQQVELEYKDMNSARTMQRVALKQDDKFSKRFIYYFAMFNTLVSFAYVYFITFTVIPKDNVRFADTCLGFLLGSLLAVIIQFFFGSSSGSKDKSLRIKDMEVAENVKDLINK